MPANATGTNGGGAYPNTIPYPLPGEFVTSNSILIVAQGAANLSRRLLDVMTGLAYDPADIPFNSQVVRFNGRTARTARTVVGDPGVGKSIGLPGSGADFEGTRFYFTQPAANRVVFVKHTGVTPVEGEEIKIIYRDATGGAPPKYTFKRDDSPTFTPICFVGAPSAGGASIDMCITLTLEYVSGVWRLGDNPGHWYDGTNEAGVIPDTGA